MEHTNAPGKKQSVDRQNVGMMRRRNKGGGREVKEARRGEEVC